MGTTADLVQLRRLVDRYGMAVDQRDVAGLVSLFADGGELLVRWRGSNETVEFTGARLGALMAVVAPYEVTLHTVTNHVADVDGDVATGRTYCTAHHLRTDQRGPSTMTLHVAYDDEYVRTYDGWRFSTRRCELLWKSVGPLRPAPAAWP